jgi:antitoxin VapB
MHTAKIFMNGRSQAVRLPKECRFAADEVVVARLDDMVVLYPREKGWDLMAKGIEHFTEDVLSDRDQPDRSEKRDTL